MLKKYALLSFIFLSFTFISFSQNGKTHFDHKSYEEGEFLVQLTSEGSISELVASAPAEYKLKLEKQLSRPMRIWLVSFDPISLSHESMQHWIYSQKNVSVADYNYHIQMRSTLPGDPSFTQQWHHNNTGQTGGTADADIDSDLAWDITTGGTTASNDDIVVCLIESGNLDHQDLTANRWINTAEIPGNNIDDDGNGYIDDISGWNPVANNGGYGTGAHGTNCLGMIGAKGDNGLNVVGANWDVKLMVVGGYSISTQANAIQAYTYPLEMRQLWNNTNGAQGAFVVATSSSWGIDGANPSNYPIWCSFYDTLGRYGIINVGATTNSNLNVDTAGDMPTACSSPYMLGVGRTDHNDNTAGGYGLTTIEFGAPGINVVTTANTNTTTTTTGTSFSCPLTAGVVALAYSIPCPDFMTLVKADPQAGANLVLQAMLDGVDVKAQLATKFITGGRLNSRGTLDALMASSCSGTICLPPYAISTSMITEVAAQVNFTPNSSASATHFYWRETGAATYTEMLNVSSPISLSGLSGCMNYQFYFQSDCSGDLSSPSSVGTFRTANCGNCIELAYCTNSADDASDEWIQSFTVGSVTNNSGSDGGYQDFENTFGIEFETFGSYPFEIGVAWGGTLYNEYSRIWIDFNQDGTFAPSELVFDQGTASQINPSGTITIPGTALIGETKMRVQMAYQGATQNTLPGICAAFTYGEVEDYCVTILEGTEPNASLSEELAHLTSIYPNPATNQLFVSNLSNLDLVMEIRDIVGKLVAIKLIAKGITEVELSPFQSGTYFYSLSDENGTILKSEKLIKVGK